MCGMEKNQKKKCKLAFGIVLGIYTIVLSSVAYGNWQSKGADFSELVDNWRFVPLVNFSTVPYASSCGSLGSNWFQISLEATDFPGSTAFCNCSSGVELAGACSVNQTNQGCQTNAAVPAISATWFNSKLCGYRTNGAANTPLEDSPYNAINRPRGTGVSPSCPTGYSLCSLASGPITASTEWACAPAGELCPISNFSRVTNAQAALVPNAQCAPPSSLDPGHTLCWSRFGNILPIQRFTNAINGTCFPGKATLTERAQTDFRIGEMRYCAPGDYDSRWTTVSEVTEPVQWTNYMATTMPAYYRQKASAGWKYVMQSRVEVSWTADCTSSRQRLSDLEPRVEQLTRVQLAVLVINIIMAIALDCLYNCWEWRQDDDLDDWKDDSTAQRCCRKSKHGCAIAFHAGKIAPLIIAIIIVLALRSSFRDMKEKPCTSEPLTQETIDFFAEETVTQSTINFFLLAGVLVGAVMEAYTCYKGYKSLDETEAINLK